MSTNARRAFVAALMLAAGATPGRAAAQEGGFSRLSVDAEASVRTSVARDGGPQTSLMVDSVSTLRTVRGVTIVTRPMMRHRVGDTWDFHLAQFTVRHDTSFRGVGVRVEGGLLPSPVGLAPFTARAASNPTITPAPPFGRAITVEPGAPGIVLYPLTYPVGIIASLSAPKWDARIGLLDSTPLRVRWPLERDQPHMAANVLVAGGVTPRPGLRLGGWMTRGAWATAAETAYARTPDRMATTGGVEVEYSVRWTRVAGEWTASRVSTLTDRSVPTMWMIEGSQGLAPRWFLAGRVRQVDMRAARAVPATTLTGAALPPPLSYTDVSDRVGELVVGYRMTPAITWRGGYVGTRPFNVASWAHRAEASLVWAYKPR